MDYKLNQEIIEKAKQAKNPEELINIAKINNVELTAEEAKVYFDKLNKIGELKDDELSDVAGGGCSSWGQQGDHVKLPGGTCPFCGAKDPTGFYKFVGGHYGFTYYMENLDCCGQTMTLGHDDVNKLIKI